MSKGMQSAIYEMERHRKSPADGAAIEAAISQARAEGRREGMEEAAQLVENQGAELHMREDDGIDRFDAAMILAANIRALSQKEAGKDAN